MLKDNYSCIYVTVFVFLHSTIFLCDCCVSFEHRKISVIQYALRNEMNNSQNGRKRDFCWRYGCCEITWLWTSRTQRILCGIAPFLPCYIFCYPYRWYVEHYSLAFIFKSGIMMAKCVFSFFWSMHRNS